MYLKLIEKLTYIEMFKIGLYRNPCHHTVNRVYHARYWTESPSLQDVWMVLEGFVTIPQLLLPLQGSWGGNLQWWLFLRMALGLHSVIRTPSRQFLKDPNESQTTIWHCKPIPHTHYCLCEKVPVQMNWCPCIKMINFQWFYFFHSILETWS